MGVAESGDQSDGCNHVVLALAPRILCVVSMVPPEEHSIDIASVDMNLNLISHRISRIPLNGYYLTLYYTATTYEDGSSLLSD